MAAPRTLSRPPIKEALIDFRAEVPNAPEAFASFAEHLAPQFPKVQTKRGFRAELKVVDGKLIPPKADDLGFDSIFMSNADETLVLQVGPQGFTLNNLNTYMGGERLMDEALRLWSLYIVRMAPVRVTRVAFRYINRLELPWRGGDDFSRFLLAPVGLPPAAPQNTSEFLSRVVADDPESQADLIVTQRLQPEVSARGLIPVLLIDVDVYRQGEFDVDAAHLRDILTSLRLLKNRTFFSLLTEEAVALYV